MNEIKKKEKEIEEIASIIDNALRSKYEWTDEKALEVADELVNKLGYRKVKDYKKDMEYYLDDQPVTIEDLRQAVLNCGCFDIMIERISEDGTKIYFERV